jgi:hypothetical protein
VPTYNIEQDGLAFRFNQSRSKIQVYGGGFGNGKTAALCVKAIQVSGDYPGANNLLARETYPKLNDTLRKEFYKWMPKALVRRWPTKDDNTLYMKNGTTINFRYIAQRGKTSEDGQTTSNLLSATYDFIGIDQIEDPGIIAKDFKDLLGRLRGTTPYRGSDPTMPGTGPRWLCATCNPTSNWFYREVIKPLHLYLSKGLITPNLIVDPRSGKVMIELYEGSTYENKQNLPDDFLAGLEASYSGQMRDRFLLGKWASYEGLVYPNFREEVHMLPKEIVLEYLKQISVEARQKVYAIEGYDFGITNPSCYLLGFVDHYGRVFIIDGFYKSEFPLDKQASAINFIRDMYREYLTFDFSNLPIADPSIFKKKALPGYKTLGESVAAIFDNDFQIKMRPGDNSIGSGIIKVSSYLNQYDHLPRFNKFESSPLMYFCDHLDYIREEFGNYFWKRNPTGETEDIPQDRNDHAMDVIKYMLSFRPKPGELITPKADVVPAYMFWTETEEQYERRAF